MIEEIYKIRYFEYRVSELFYNRELTGTTHLSIGYENIPLLLAEKYPEAVVFSNHRSHVHYLAHTGDYFGLMSELFNKKRGCCRGNGGSQHLNFRDRFFSNGIIGGMLPIAAGYAFSNRLKGDNVPVIAYIGDGALDQGIVYESFSLIEKFDIPIKIVIEDNGMAMSTETNVANRVYFLKKAFALDDKIDYFKVERHTEHSKGQITRDTLNFDGIVDEIPEDRVKSIESEIDTIITTVKNI